MSLRKVWPAIFVLLAAGFYIPAEAAGFNSGILGGPPSLNNVEDEAPWKEEAAEYPRFPKDEDLLEFYVSAGTSNRFFVDGASIAPGKDGVVRYTLVIRTSGGAVNITYEGMRCETLEVKIYAMGTAAGAWSKARKGEWQPIENKPINRYHAALSRDLFCPAGVQIQSNEEGRRALRLGKHPGAA